MQSEGPPVRSRVALGALVLSLLVGAVVLVLGMIEEPYHIDELRQARSYDDSWRRVVGAAFEQEQPPLDPLLGSAVQRVLGVGHVAQRLHPTILGIGSLVLLAILLWRSGLRIGAAVAVLLYGLASIVVSVTAYARPYSLPIFLGMACLLGGDLWLRERRRWGLVVAAGGAALLPAARAVEPVIFLVGAAAALQFIGRPQGRGEGSPRILQAVVGVSVAFVAIPVYLKLRSELAPFTAGSASLLDRTERLVRELPGHLDEGFVVGGLALLLVVIALSRRGVGSFLWHEWWVWPIIAVPIGFAGAFFLLARIDQPYFPRYTYTWWLPFAVVMGVLVDRLFSERSGRAADGATAFLLVLFTAAVVYAQVEDLTSDAWVDYEPLGGVIEARLDPATVVLFDDAVAFGRYREGYAGRERFVAEGRLLPTATQIVANPSRVPDDRPFAVAINGPPVAVLGWTRVEASDGMNLYLPEQPALGRAAAAATLSDFGVALGELNGSMLRLAAAAALVELGDLESACVEVAETVDGDGGLAESIVARFGSADLVVALMSCPGGDPLGGRAR